MNKIFRRITMAKKFLSILLTLVLVLGLLPAAGAAAVSTSPTFSDMPDNWATEALESAVANGLLVGDDGKIMPDSPLTRAQMATIIARAFGATEEGDISEYTDVKSTDWFAVSMAKAYKMGVMQGYAGKMDPNNSITREQAFAVLARALKFELSSTINKTFEDEGEISDWAKGEVYALVNAGYIQGSNGKLNPQANISRAEFAQMMHNLIKQYIKAEGEYTQVADGNIMINVPNVTLKNVTITGDLIVGDGVGDGDLILDNVTIKGRLLARGGGANSIIIIGGSVEGKVVVAKVDGNIRVSVEGGADVEVIVINDGKDDVIIEGTVGTVEVTAPDVPVIIQNATISKINVNCEGSADITVAETGSVTNVVVGDNSEGTAINVEGNITNIETSAPDTGISGTGVVGTVTANEGADNTSVTTPNTVVNNEGASGVTAGGGKEVPEDGSSTNNNDGSDIVTSPPSGDGPSYVGVDEISVEPEQLEIAVAQTMGIITTVLPANASDKRITWSSSNESVATVNDSGEVTGIALGTAVITVTSVYNSNIKTDIEVTVGPALTVSGSILKGEQSPSIILSTTDDTFTSNATNSDNWQITLFTDSGPVGLIDIGVTGVEITLGEDNESVTITFNGAINSLGTLLIAPNGEVFTAGTSSGVVFCDIIEVSKLEKNYYAAGDILTFTISGLEPNEEVNVYMPIFTGIGGWPWASDEPVISGMVEDTVGDPENPVMTRTFVGTTDSNGVLTVSGTVQAELPNGVLHITLPDYGYTIDNAIEMQDIQGVGVRIGDPIINTTTNEGYTTIQAAIDAAIAGDTILVGPGTYEEQLEINKPLTLLGPNADIAGYSEDRVNEAIITYPAEMDTTSENLVYGAADSISINGFTFINEQETADVSYREIWFTGYNYNFSNNYVISYADKIAVHFGTNNQTPEPNDNTIVKDNYIESTSSWASLYLQGRGGTVEGNMINGGIMALQIQPYANSGSGTVYNNTLSGYDTGIWHNFATKGSGTWIYELNDISAKEPTNTYRWSPKYWRGITITTYGTTGSGNDPHTIFLNNSINGEDASVGETWEEVIGIHFNANISNTATFEFTDNTIQNVTLGVYRAVGQADLDSILANNTFPEGFNVLGNQIKMLEDGKIYISNTGVEYATIQAAIDAATAGDTILLGSGEYKIHWNGNVGLKLYKSLNIIGEDENSVVIRPETKGTPTTHRLIQTGYDQPAAVTLKNITIDGNLTDGSNGGVSRGINVYNYGAGLGSSLSLENVTIQNIIDDSVHDTTGLYFLTGGNATSSIKNVTIKNYGWTGVLIGSLVGDGDQIINIDGLHIDGRNDKNYLTNGLDIRGSSYRNLTIDANHVYIENCDYIDDNWEAFAILVSPEAGHYGSEDVCVSLSLENSLITNSANALHFESSGRADNINVQYTIFDLIANLDLVWFGPESVSSSSLTVNQSYSDREGSINYLISSEDLDSENIGYDPIIYLPEITNSFNNAEYPTSDFGKDTMSFTLSNIYN